MEAYMSGKFSDAVNTFKQKAEEERLELEQTQTHDKDKDKDKDPRPYAAALCNVAAAELAMELNRRGVRTADAAIKADPKCLRAYVLKGRGLAALGKRTKAVDAWRIGVFTLAL